MALAKVYDTADTIMVPLDAESTEGLVDVLYYVAAVLENRSYEEDAETKAERIRKVADAIDEARTAAGLDN